MESSSCGVAEKDGKTLAGQIFGTDGQHKRSQEVLCQDYVLKSDRIVYRIRPKDDKHPVLLPVGESAEFRIHKDNVVPRLNQALTDDSVAIDAMNLGFSWTRQVDLSILAGTGIFDANEQFIRQQAEPILINYFNKAWGRCQNDTAAADRLTETQKMLTALRNIIMLIREDYLTVLPDANRQVNACALGKLKLDFDSQMNGLVNGVRESARVQANNAMLTLNTTTWQYTASTVPLNEISVSYSNPDPADCSILNVGSGTTGVQADIDLNVGAGSLLKSADVRVTMDPQVQEIFTPGGVVEGSCQLGMPSASAVAYYPFWLVTHLAGTGFAPYNTLLNTPKAIGSSGSQGGISATETGNITVSQVDP